MICFADRVGGFHPNVGNNNWNHEVNGFHNDNGGRVGNYYPGNGWVAPAYIINNSENANINCQPCDPEDVNCVQDEGCN